MNSLIIAHRGARAFAVENTLSAFQKALDQKADGIELDIFLTCDGEVVVIHDEAIRQSDGSRLFIRKSTVDELKKVDLSEGEKIPTLREVFHHFSKSFSVIDVEIKSTGYFTDGIEEKLLALIEEYQLHDRVLISSFNPLHLLRVKNRNPKIKTGFLISPHHWFARRPLWIRKSQAFSVNPEHKWLTPKRLDKYRKMHKEIWVWTVNHEDEMRKWFHQGAEAIITDNPLLARKVREEIHCKGGLHGT